MEASSGQLNATVTVDPILSVPAVITVLTVRLMIHVTSGHRNVICVAVKLMTVPVSVLFPGIGMGDGLNFGP